MAVRDAPAYEFEGAFAVLGYLALQNVVASDRGVARYAYSAREGTPEDETLVYQPCARVGQHNDGPSLEYELATAEAVSCGDAGIDPWPDLVGKFGRLAPYNCQARTVARALALSLIHGARDAGQLASDTEAEAWLELLGPSGVPQALLDARAAAAVIADAVSQGGGMSAEDAAARAAAVAQCAALAAQPSHGEYGTDVIALAARLSPPAGHMVATTDAVDSLEGLTLLMQRADRMQAASSAARLSDERLTAFMQCLLARLAARNNPLVLGQLWEPLGVRGVDDAAVRVEHMLGLQAALGVDVVGMAQALEAESMDLLSSGRVWSWVAATETLEAGRAAIDERVRRLQPLLATVHSRLGLVVASRSGVLVMTTFGPALLSRKQVVAARELLLEQLGVSASLTVEKSPQAAATQHSVWLSTVRAQAGLPQWASDGVGSMLRDLEMAVKGAVLEPQRAFSRDDLREGLQRDYGATCTAAMPLLCANVEGWELYELARATRAIPQVVYNAVQQANQHYVCMHPDVRVDDDVLAEYGRELKRVIAHSHLAIWKEWPASLTNLLETRADDERLAAAESRTLSDLLLDAWQPNGEGKFDMGAADVHDSTHVPDELAPDAPASAIAALGGPGTREVLVYAQRRWEDDVAAAVRRLEDGSDPYPVDLLTDKPENKLYSRVITMEQGTRRKVNSVWQNNVAALTTPLPGSLLGASSDKLAQTVEYNTELLARWQLNDPASVAVFCGIDFTKFGHYIHIDLQLTTARILQQYFGVTWGVPMMEQLRRLTVVSRPCGLVTRFWNDAAADGQGMRNGQWQLMLAGMQRVVLKRARAEVPAIDDQVPVCASWFQDDHTYPLVLTAPHRVRRQGTAAVRSYAERAGDQFQRVASRTYRMMGLDTSPEKGYVSTHYYAQTGDLYCSTGIRHPASKALANAAKSSSHRAPRLLDRIDEASASAHGAVYNGANPAHAFVVAAWAAGRAASRLAQRSAGWVDLRLGAFLVLPRAVGGGGLPTIGELLVNRGVLKPLEGLWCGYRHILMANQLSTHFADLLAGPGVEMDPVAVAASPLVAKRAWLPNTSNALEAELRRKAPLFVRFCPDLELLRRDAAARVQKVINGYDELPLTALNAMYQSSPHTAVDAEVSKVAMSATAQALLSPAGVAAARYENARRDVKLMEGILASRGGPPVSVRGFGEFVITLAWPWPRGFSQVHHPPLAPLVWLAYPTERDDEGLTAENLPRHPSLGAYVISTGKPAPSPVPTGGMHLNPRQQVLLLGAEAALGMETAEQRVRSVYGETVLSPLGGDQLRAMATRGATSSPFRDAASLAYLPPARMPGLAWLTSKSVLDSRPVESMHPEGEFVAPEDVGRRFHVNYPMYQAAAYMHESIRPGVRRTYALSAMGVWDEPKPTCREGTAAARSRTSEYLGEALTSLSRVVAMATSGALPGPGTQAPGDDEAARLFLRQNVLDAVEMVREATALHGTQVQREALAVPPPPESQDVAVRSLRHLLESGGLTKTEAAVRLVSGAASHTAASAAVSGAPLARAVSIVLDPTIQRADDSAYFEEAAAAVAPTRTALQQMDAVAVELGITDELMVWLRRKHSQRAHGAVPMAAGRPSQLLQALVRNTPTWWCEQLATVLEALPAVAPDAPAGDRAAAFYHMWADRYAHQYQVHKEIVREWKRAERDAGREPRVRVAWVRWNEAQKQVYLATQAMPVLSYMYDALAANARRASAAYVPTAREGEESGEDDGHGTSAGDDEPYAEGGAARILPGDWETITQSAVRAAARGVARVYYKMWNVPPADEPAAGPSTSTAPAHAGTLAAGGRNQTIREVRQQAESAPRTMKGMVVLGVLSAVDERLKMLTRGGGAAWTMDPVRRFNEEALPLLTRRQRALLALEHRHGDAPRTYTAALQCVLAVLRESDQIMSMRNRGQFPRRAQLLRSVAQTMESSRSGQHATPGRRQDEQLPPAPLASAVAQLARQQAAQPALERAVRAQAAAGRAVRAGEMEEGAGAAGDARNRGVAHRVEHQLAPPAPVQPSPGILVAAERRARPAANTQTQLGRSRTAGAAPRAEARVRATRGAGPLHAFGGVADDFDLSD